MDGFESGVRCQEIRPECASALGMNLVFTLSLGVREAPGEFRAVFGIRCSVFDIGYSGVRCQIPNNSPPCRGGVPEGRGGSLTFRPLDLRP